MNTKHLLYNRVSIIFFVALSFTMTSCMDTTTKADLLLSNAKIWTANPEMPFAEALAIKGEKIICVGSLKDCSQFQDNNTKVLDADGNLVVPGFIDSHVHFLTGGASLSAVKLKDAPTKQEFIDRIRDFAKTLKSDEWMLEGNWDHENWGGDLPTKDWIDEFTQDIPVFINRSDGHMALANSAAMKLAGITDNVEDIDGGEIVRDHKGSPTGIFKDNAMPLVANSIPDYSDEQKDKALEAAMDYVLAHGVSSVHHMGTIADMEVFERAREKGNLKTRIFATGPIPSREKIVEKLAEPGFNDHWLKIGGAKLFADGSLGSRTAAFLEDYLGYPGESGLLMDEVEDMEKGIFAADSLGLQVVVHAIGDRANRIILDLYDKSIQKNGDRDRRFRIEHAQHLNPSDIQRFANLNVIASMQPWHLADDGRWANALLGDERVKEAYSFRSLLDAGVKLAFGSDWYVAPPHPIEGIYYAVTRQTLSGNFPDGWTPEQKITVEEALIAYTRDAAFASFEENIKGSLKEGMLADFVILDQDILTIDPSKIIKTNVLTTVVGGKVLYQASTY